jgi:hypothetical protein
VVDVSFKSESKTHILKLVWFMCISLYEWLFLRDVAWLPSVLGGLESSSYCSSSFSTSSNKLAIPEDSVWNVNGLGYQDSVTVFIYALQAAYHFHSQLYAIFEGAKLEMHVHHSATMLLILMSHSYGFHRIGCVIFFLHDVSDIAGYLTKSCFHSKRIVLLMASTFLLLTSWAYFRLYSLLVIALSVWCDAPLAPILRSCFSLLIFVLLFLQYYWYAMFLRTLYSFLAKAEVKDASEVRSVTLKKSE